MPDIRAETSSPSSSRTWYWLAIAVLVVLVRGLFIDVMDIDASQYASIAMALLQHGQWLELRYHQLDYLDKPPLLFWSGALSFAAFGVRTWAYKLPSFLAAIAGIHAVYRFSLLFYSRAVARNAAFIVATCVGTILMCNDVRTDALLFGTTVCATWQFAAWLESSRTHLAHLLLGGLFVGMAMLAKGPIGFVVPASAVATHLAMRREWRRLFSARWIPAIVVTALVLVPMCWGLYEQFDLHPEKVVHGQAGTSGLRFFFWDQSFGRLASTSAWRDDTSPLYFVHTFLWVFLPWSLLFIGALWRRCVELARTRGKAAAGDEGYSIGGFILPFAALSLSHYKLPHYIFVVLPWAAILAARWLDSQLEAFRQRGTTIRLWWLGQYVVFAVLATSLAWLLVAAFPGGSQIAWLGMIGAFGLLLVMSARGPAPASADAMVQRAVIAAIGLGFVLNFHVFPSILRYQASSQAARAARELGVPAGRIVSYRKAGDALSVYAGRLVPLVASVSDVRRSADSLGEVIVFTDSVGRTVLDSAGMSGAAIASLQDFPVARLSTRFLSARSRPATLHPSYLLRIPRRQAP